jgi:hypothetical protein
MDSPQGSLYESAREIDAEQQPMENHGRLQTGVYERLQTDTRERLQTSTDSRERPQTSPDGIVKLLGMIVSPGTSRHFPDAIATDPPFRPPVCYP